MSVEEITLVTSDDPPVEIKVERKALRDSRVFADMLALPATAGDAARVDVAETSSDLEPFLAFLSSGAFDVTAREAGRRVVAIARLIDKYDCEVAGIRFLSELWKGLYERALAADAILLASDYEAFEPVQRHAAAQFLCRSGLNFQQSAAVTKICRRIGSDHWKDRFKRWESALKAQMAQLVFDSYPPFSSCTSCGLTQADIWRAAMFQAAHDSLREDAIVAAIVAEIEKRKICSRHIEGLVRAARRSDDARIRSIPAFPN